MWSTPLKQPKESLLDFNLHLKSSSRKRYAVALNEKTKHTNLPQIQGCSFKVKNSGNVLCAVQHKTLAEAHKKKFACLI
jgi:uncharacterized protein with WD repeat